MAHEKKYPAATNFVGSPAQGAWYSLEPVFVRQTTLSLRVCEYSGSTAIRFTVVWT